uniref:Uncharacterized protein n=1 Tax=Romanomermis culicivorax TaxID=13658 RepID=A0A915IEI4_ROMCU
MQIGNGHWAGVDKFAFQWSATERRTNDDEIILVLFYIFGYMLMPTVMYEPWYEGLYAQAMVPC